MNEFHLNFTPTAEDKLLFLKEDPSKKVEFKAIRKSLSLMCANLRHPSLHTHKYDGLQGPNGEEIFESYAQNKTPGAYRIFWFYGPGRLVITIFAIAPHP